MCFDLTLKTPSVRRSLFTDEKFLEKCSNCTLQREVIIVAFHVANHFLVCARCAKLDFNHGNEQFEIEN